MQTDETSPNIAGVVGSADVGCCWQHCPNIAGVVGSPDVGWCWQLCANGPNNFQQYKDVQCIMGRIRLIRLRKLTKFGCHLVFNMFMCCYLQGDHMKCACVAPRAVETDPNLLRYASAITEQKKYWELLAQKFDQFQTSRNVQLPTTRNKTQ